MLIQNFAAVQPQVSVTLVFKIFKSEALWIELFGNDPAATTATEILFRLH